MKPKIEKRIEKGIIKTAKKIEKFEWRHRNLFYLLISIALAYFILTSSYIRDFFANAGTFGYIDSFIIGFFFPHGLTVIPATSAFLVLAENLSPLVIALIGAVGAVISDYIIFRFIGDKLILGFEEIADDISHSLKKEIERIKTRAIKSKLFRRFIPIIAGVILASPLPDELVAILFKTAKFEPKKFLIYAYIFHFIGIFIIATIGKIF